jgi:hypothetical protein
MVSEQVRRSVVTIEITKQSLMSYRRAKLKRVTQDDRENIVRSRALPDNFDLSTALQSPFGPPSAVSVPPQTPTSNSSGAAAERTVRSLAPAAQYDQQSVLGSPYSSTPTSSSIVQLSPLDICRPFGIFLPTGFQAVSEDLPKVFTQDSRDGLQQPQPTSHPQPSMSQVCDFADAPLSTSLHCSSPAMSPYGLGFSCKAI